MPYSRTTLALQEPSLAGAVFDQAARAVRAVRPPGRSGRPGGQAVGSSPRLSDSQTLAESASGRARLAAATGGPGGAPGALPRDGRSYRLDMTGHRVPRQATSSPATTTIRAPAIARPRHGNSASTTWPAKPAI